MGRRALSKTVCITTSVSVLSPLGSMMLLILTLQERLYCSKLFVLAVRSAMILSFAALPSVVLVLNYNFLLGHRQPVLSEHPVRSLVLLSQEQVPSLQIQHLRTGSDSLCSRKIAFAAQS
jgi:hypothetical protein